MPYFPTSLDMAAHQPSNAETSDIQSTHQEMPREAPRDRYITVKNRRRRYLDTHPEYFGPSLELADPLLYDRLIRRFQSSSEREAEGRAKGYSGILEADILRSEAKLNALAHPDPNSILTYKRGPDGEILAEDKDDVPVNQEEGRARWVYEMEMRFIRGDDKDFEYKTVDDNEDLDDISEEDRIREDAYFREEEPSWILDDEGGGRKEVTGETGIQDF
ncbi:hypothetical protein EJ05DRAFT_351033 [Pseudovirgaria hyperparasitica]|uniref:CCD97-like C-terminal domain-containing protein n=1 Tax=Pseudovirgaria hyperparasitica TaxID=470096 RepID=A0A6A6W8R6_9PEZI|nr:uncharacterized protein EJ05DRAFT_351033 [Pseudovirgaria hyperparasitica]KAF2758424.1 hypothetical protein EJ05DRAFT_351033 [Pseudovirgaria hyperparasitica]